MASSLPQKDLKKLTTWNEDKETHDTVLHRGVLDFGKLHKVARRLVGAMATKRGEAHGCSKTSSCPSLALKRTSHGENAVSHLVWPGHGKVWHCEGQCLSTTSPLARAICSFMQFPSFSSQLVLRDAKLNTGNVFCVSPDSFMKICPSSQ